MPPDYIELVRDRRSVREFTDTPVSEEQIERLKETALRAPTSRNLHPCEFIFVTNNEILAKLSKCKPHGAAFLAGAPLGVVVCADETRSDVWVEDGAIASIMLQFAAQSLGLGSCWLQVRKRKTADGTDSETYIRNLLKLSEPIRVLSIIGIGHPAEKPPPLSVDQLLFERIHSDLQ